MMRKRKGEITFILISVLISLVGFFIFLNFFMGQSQTIETQLEAQSCRALMSAQSELKNVTGGQFIEFIADIGRSCVILEKDDVKVTSANETFTAVAKEMQSCWYRYGEGEYNFLNGYSTEGNYCFLCTKLSFEENNQLGNFKFSEFIDWSEKNFITFSNGSKISYYNYMQMKYADISAENKTQMLQALDEISSLGNSLGEDEKKELLKLHEFFQVQYQYALDLDKKKISTLEPTYIVYRFDKREMDVDQLLENVRVGMQEGAITSVVITGATTIAVSVIMAPFTFGGSLVAGAGALAKGAVAAVKIEKTFRNLRQIVSAIKLTKKISAITALTVGTGAVVGAVANADYNLNNLQYVDVLTQEQYFRQCGTMPPTEMG